jgi:hypothetical protein
MENKELRETIREILREELPMTNIISKSFWSRAFAVLGHDISAGIIIYIAILLVSIGIAGFGVLFE